MEMASCGIAGISCKPYHIPLGNGSPCKNTSAFQMCIPQFIAFAVFDHHIIAIAVIIGRSCYRTGQPCQYLRTFRHSDIHSIVELVCTGDWMDPVSVIAAYVVIPVEIKWCPEHLQVALCFVIGGKQFPLENPQTALADACQAAGI
ncbi:hypothetical protein BN165_1040046 [Clostridioides difficile E1]|nr:hypothetical protein BN165_1040046 [Clostridioides difficile E1]